MEEPVTTSSEIHTNESKGGREGGRECKDRNNIDTHIHVCTCTCTW